MATQVGYAVGYAIGGPLGGAIGASIGGSRIAVDREWIQDSQHLM